MLPIPALVIGYLNPDFLRKRILELLNSGFGPIYVFIDGCDVGEKVLQNRKCVDVAEEFVRSNLVIDIHSPQSNLGQGKGIPYAINWFFSHQNFGLILEDDCQISPSLHSYIDDNSWRVLDPESEIAVLCASNIFPVHRAESVFLSPLFESWGWATSSQKWSKYYCQHIEMIDVNEAVSKLHFVPKILRRRLARSWSIESRRIASGAQNTWALRFTLGILAKNGKCVFPRENQILHISHESAIHVTETPNWYKDLALGEYQISGIRNPVSLSRRHVRLTLRHMYGISFFPFFWRVLGAMRRVFT